MMKQIRLLSFVAALFTLAGVSSRQGQSAPIPIVVSSSASEGERLAAQDLVAALQRIYPREQFVLGEQLPEAGRCILAGNAQSDPEVKRRLGSVKPDAPESFVVTTASEGARQLGLIAGADRRGTAYGVYALLEKLGCGFFLSYDAWPAPRTNAFSFDDWRLADRPLAKDRIVFDWHNFLSGCSTWNFEDWQRWTAQSRKMGYNAIMVHGYGNNPMVSFTINGKTKPVGYLSTTARGRDWSTMHVNDVRRLWGGEVFNQPVFGAEAAICPEDERAASAQRLMQQVFADAARRDMEVLLAVDVDTPSANPQELIATLPPDARFAISAQAATEAVQKDRQMWLANPETPEGYRYYKAQVDAILQAYPQVTCLVVWFRAGHTPWTEMKESEMPPLWQEEYRAEIVKTPEAAKFWHAHQVFALGKIIRAFDRALKELGHDRVQLASGTWRFDFLPPCDRFFPPHVKLIGLDYEVLHDRPQLGDAESRKVIRDAGAHRAVVPVIWAHHDDGNYIGRSYTPFADFASKLADANASGFGIIHWTTRPLDLFFKSHVQQVWQGSKDQPLRAACDDMAAKSFGLSTRGKMGEYLERWVTDAPKFGRETSDWFIDKPLTNVNEIVAGCRERLKLITAVDPAQLASDQRDRLNYFKGLEEFIIAFFHTQDLFQRSQAALRGGRLAEARDLIQQARPESIIEQFARFSSLGGITRGEQGLVVTMNLRWLTHIIRHRQALGLEPVCVSFGPTMHEPLAQSAGKFTFDVTTNRLFWERWGEQETGAATWTLPPDAKLILDKNDPGAWADIGRRGIAFDKPLKLRLQPIMGEDSRGRSKPANLPPGEYLVRLLFANATQAAAGPRACEVVMGSGLAFRAYEFDPVPAKFLRLICVGNSRNDWNSLVEVQLDSVATRGGTPAVLASSNSSVRYPARNVLDGDPDTRWAARGTNEWIQFELAPGATAQRIGLVWYQGDSRRARFKVQVSNDGVQWNPVTNLQRSKDSGSDRSRVEFTLPAGQTTSAIERSFRVNVGTTGCVDLSLTPTGGRLGLCGVVVEPLVNPGQAESKNFSASAIAAVMKKVNAWQIAHPLVKPAADRDWIRATWYTGVMAAHGATGDEDYLKQATRWAESNQWQPGKERSGANILTCGQTYLELHSLKPDPQMLAPTITWLDSGASNTPSGAKVWYLEAGRRYVDSLYVGPPALAMLAKTTGNHKYLDWMNEFYWDVHGELFDHQAGLFYRDQRFIGAKSANGRKVIWSRGNGWAFAGLPRILDHLPQDDPTRPRYVELFKTMAASLAKRQAADGLWRPNLDDPDDFQMPETSGTGFFCYGLAWGIRNGLLDGEAYLPVVKKAWSGLVRCVNDEGQVQWGQLVGAFPVSVQREHTHEYVTGTFLLAGSEVLRFVQSGVLAERKQ